MNKYEKALEELSFPLISSDCGGCKCGESDCSCEKREAVETLQELVDFNKTFAHVLGSIDFKALRNILETKLPKKPIKKETVTLSMLNIDVTFGKCPTCGSALAGKQNYCTKCGQALDWRVEDEKL